MSHPHIPPGRCARAKMIFLSEGEALRRLNNKREWGAGMRPYYCPQCRAYHVGHPGPKDPVYR